MIHKCYTKNFSEIFCNIHRETPVPQSILVMLQDAGWLQWYFFRNFRTKKINEISIKNSKGKIQEGFPIL